MNTTILAKTTWGFSLLFIDFLLAPKLSMIIIVLGAMGLDFVTGIAKAKFLKLARTSEGYRKTIIKSAQYLVPIIVLWIGAKFIPEYKIYLQRGCGWLMMFIIYIEVTSIFENLYEIDKTSIIAKFVYRPSLKILKFGIENNPVAKAGEDAKYKTIEEEKNQINQS